MRQNKEMETIGRSEERPSQATGCERFILKRSRSRSKPGSLFQWSPANLPRIVEELSSKSYRRMTLPLASEAGSPAPRHHPCSAICRYRRAAVAAVAWQSPFDKGIRSKGEKRSSGNLCLPGRNSLRALPDRVESRDRKGIAQIQRVGTCPGRKSRATFSGRAQCVLRPVVAQPERAIRPLRLWRRCCIRRIHRYLASLSCIVILGVLFLGFIA